ncbi:MAG TPA: ABC transporter permease [Geminicoccaceae bacterium]|nr:ABC transporter permease [Geminicoccus sp.]HMU48812.1 ABC transporter permease [Geminicoccaceae bacterium]
MALPSPSRILAMMLKELIQMRRDRLTFGMMLGVPVMQLLLFGYAINTDPQYLPAAVQIRDHSPFARSFVAALGNTRYFRIVGSVASEAEADAVLDRGEAMFVVTIPEDFSRDLVRGDRPALLVEVDATDPVAAGNAVSALNELARTALDRDLDGTLADLRAGEPPFDLVLHRRYNPERTTAYNVVPGLLGVILTMTMVLMTALAVTRETERGTMENLLAMPLRPGEVMLGKILPYVAVGYVQVTVVLLAARYLFGVPMLGSLLLLSVALLAFIGANLAVGFTFSTLARNQLQAMQLTFFFFLPSILLSGFMFPFAGMPGWAQVIGEVLPLTHFVRIVRGVLLKGNGFAEIWPNVWPLLLFMTVVSTVALKRYRRTLD